MFIYQVRFINTKLIQICCKLNQQKFDCDIFQMRIHITQKIKTEIISNMEIDRFTGMLAIITRKLSDINSQYDYYLQTYNGQNLQIIQSKYLYSSYNDRRHNLAIGIQSIAVEIRGKVLIMNKNNLKINSILRHNHSIINGMGFSSNQRFIGVAGEGVTVWQTNNGKIITISNSSQLKWIHFFQLQFAKIGNNLVMATLNQISIYTYNLDQFQLVSTSPTNDNLQSYINSLETSPINKDQLLIGRASTNPNFFSIKNQTFYSKSQSFQPNLKNNIKVAEYLADGKGFISSDLYGIGIWPDYGQLTYFDKDRIISRIKTSNDGKYIYNFVWTQLRKIQIQSKCPQDNIYKNSCDCPLGQYWSISSFVCRSLQCLSDENSTGKISNNNQCVCKANYIFDTITAKCLFNCNKSNKAFRNNKQPLLCSCQYPYIWDQNALQCKFSCEQFGPVAKITPVSFGQCQCAFGLQWNSTTFSCECQTIYQKFTYQFFQCQCLTGYVRNLQTKKCQINCLSVAIPYSTGNNIGAQQCQCENSKFIVNNQGVYGCFKNCSKIQHAVSGIQSNQGCLCQQHYMWDGNKCIVNCAQASQLETFLAQNICKCPVNYFWKIQIAQCARNCTNQLFAIVPGSTFKKCNCLDNFQWSQDFSKCQINCSRVKDATIYQKSVSQCECRLGFSWNETIHGCSVNCSDIDDASRQLSDHQCFCSGGKVFDRQEAICVAGGNGLIFGNVWATVGIVCAAIILLILIFTVGRYVMGKYKNFKTKEVQLKSQTVDKLTQRKTINSQRNPNLEVLESNPRIRRKYQPSTLTSI